VASSLKSLVKSVVVSDAGWSLASRLRPQGVTVLMYHRLTDEGGDRHFAGMHWRQFRDQMRWLHRACRPIAVADLVEAVADRRSSVPPVLVTFDDGYRDFFDLAYPILAELRIPSVVFLATQVIDGGGLIWTEQVSVALLATRFDSVVLPWNGERWLLTNDAERWRCRRACTEYLKAVPNHDREHWQTELFRTLAVKPASVISERQMLTWDEVRAMKESVTFGGHTHTHPILSRVDKTVMAEEIILCRDRIAAEIGEVPRTFAYPNGRAQDFTEVTKSLLKEHGFELAFSTVEGICSANMDPFAIKRQPTSCVSLGDFAMLVLGRIN
jgi:peptidoglycan/xylan/chitin deacetylase (PgdA/CDA1 family)